MNEDDRPEADAEQHFEMPFDANPELPAPTPGDRLYPNNPDSPVSAPGESPYSPGIGDVLYCWQMRVEDGWNIIGMMMPNGVTLPLVTTSMHVAWEAIEVAQAHANRDQCQVRLAAFRFDSLAAIVEPNE